MLLSGFERTIFIISLVLNGNFLLFSFFLFYKKSINHKANKILSAGLINIVLVNLGLSLYNTTFYYYFPHFIKIYLPFLYTIILSPYFYFQAILDVKFKFNKSHLVHLILPFLILCYETQYYLAPVELKIDFIKNHLYDKHYFFSALVYIQLIIYLVLIFRRYYDIKRNLQPEQDENNEVLKWLKEFLWIVMLIFFGELVPVFLVPFKLNPLLYIPLVDSAMFYLLVFKAIGNPMVFMKLGVIDELIRETKNNKTFMLKETDVQVMREQLNRVIEGKELFYKPEMSLAYLSGKLKIPEHHLTQLLNKIYKCNFNELVNSIRVEEVKKRLNNPDFNKLTIEGIGESVGFTSRITFHKVFKRFTQLTPLEYKKKSNQ